MKLISLFFVGLTAACLSQVAVADNPSNSGNSIMLKQPTVSSIKTATVGYVAGNVTMIGYIAYDSAIKGKRPVVMVIHEWWGLNDYVKMRTRKLAALGYLAMAVDLYGDGTVAATPDEAMKLAGPFYKDPQVAKTRFDAALALIKTYSQADAANIAAIGYCFGGGMALNIARLGEDLKGVVSFHGSLIGVPADKNLLKAKLLICHGGDDKFVKPEDVAEFKKQMDSIGADYQFKIYAGATHAFTNPNATEVGKKFSMPIAYNPAADAQSWQDMRDFFGKLFE